VRRLFQLVDERHRVVFHRDAALAAFRLQQARLATDSVSALRGLLESGCGVSALDEFSAADAIRAGRLVRVLPNWALGRGGIHAVFPPGRHMPAKVRAFVDFYVAWLKQ
jgi:DNA-binding transcriptional LysR family regulator